MKFILLCSEHIQFEQNGKLHKSMGQVTLDEVEITSWGAEVCKLHQERGVYYTKIALVPEIIHGMALIDEV